MRKLARRKRLNRDLVKAVRVSSIPLCQLASLSGYRHKENLSQLLRAQWIASTPLHAERLRRLAEAVGFTAEVWS